MKSIAAGGNEDHQEEREMWWVTEQTLEAREKAQSNHDKKTSGELQEAKKLKNMRGSKIVEFAIHKSDEKQAACSKSGNLPAADPHAAALLIYEENRKKISAARALKTKPQGIFFISTSKNSSLW